MTYKEINDFREKHGFILDSLDQKNGICHIGGEDKDEIEAEDRWQENETSANHTCSHSSDVVLTD